MRAGCPPLSVVQLSTIQQLSRGVCTYIGRSSLALLLILGNALHYCIGRIVQSWRLLAVWVGRSLPSYAPT